MRGNQNLQSIRTYEGGVARQHNRKPRSPQGAFGDLHGVTGAVLRLLQYGERSARLDNRGDLFGLVPDYDHSFPRLQRFTCAYDLFDERPTTGPVQHFRQAGLPPGSIAARATETGKHIVSNRLSHTSLPRAR